LEKSYVAGSITDKRSGPMIMMVKNSRLISIAAVLIDRKNDKIFHAAEV
jgi:hypothetical protein